MARNPYPSELADRFQVRMPEGLRDRIAAAAEANNRSMNSEIVSRLEATFTPEVEAIILGGAVQSEGEQSVILDEIRQLRRELRDVGLIPSQAGEWLRIVKKDGD